MNALRPLACADSDATTTGYLFSYDLQPGPADKLSVVAGFLETAEEHGLLWVLHDDSHVYRLPDGAVWGEFPTLTAAIHAFEKATQAASELLGYTVRLKSRMVTALDESRLWPEVSKPVNPKLIGKTRFETSRLHQLFDPPAGGLSGPRRSR